MFFQSVKMALSAIAANKVRSFLTMLGIIIGVIALVVLVSIVSSATNTIKDQVNSMGSDMLSVTITDSKGNPLRLNEIYELPENTDEIGLCAPIAQTNTQARVSDKEESATVYGTTAAYAQIRNLTLDYGRFIKKSDVNNSTYTAVISYELAKELFGSAKLALSQNITLLNRPFKVIGVLEESDGSLNMFGSEYTAYIPFTTAARAADSVSSYVSSFTASPSQGKTTDEAETALNTVLTARFKGDDEAFSIMNTSVIEDAMNSITGTLSLLLGGIAAISLLVGGIGIMNIMLVSVTERTREIGIRKAIGASTKSILLQFLTESLILSLLGCLIGIVLSWVIIEIIGVIAGEDYSFSISGSIVVISILFSISIGVIFGISPAKKAANMNPIEALRYE